MTTVETYYGVNGATHKSNYTRLKSKGYRLLSLSVYGDFTSPLYAAVWVQRDGPDWEGFQGSSTKEFQTMVDRLTAEGYVCVLLSVVGTTSQNAVFAGAFEKGQGFLTRYHLAHGDDNDAASFQGQNKWALSKSFRLRFASVYGNSKSPLYAAIWELNPDVTHWLATSHETEAEYETWSTACSQLPFRPAFVSLASSFRRCVSIFRDLDVGADWVSKHGLDGPQLQSVVDNQKLLGLHPVCVQGGLAAAPRYTAIFAKQDIPSSKIFTTKGTSVAELEPLDDIVIPFMKKYGVRAGQLTAAKDGVVKFAKAYTYADSTYPITQPSTRMRLASVSKAFTSAAITAGIRTGLVDTSARVFPLLGITSVALPSQIPSPFIDSITIQHLIDHAGGWKAGESGFDPCFGCRKIAALLNISRPGITKWDIARYMYGEPLQFQPGTQDYYSSQGTSYSNLGYILLGLVIEKLSGQPYIDYLQENVLVPLKISDVVVGGTRRDQLRSDEASYDQPLFGPPLDPRSNELTPYVYGGEGYKLEATDSGGGLIASATSVTTLIHSYAVWGIGKRIYYARYGGMAGTASYAESRYDGVDYAYIFNTRDFPDAAIRSLDGIVNKFIDFFNATPIVS